MRWRHSRERDFFPGRTGASRQKKLSLCAASMALVVLTSSAMFGSGQGITTTDSYERDMLKWRQDREDGLKADNGWLTVTGLFWLEPGENTFGSDPSNTIVLPAGAPPRVGAFEFKEEKTSVRLAPGVIATLNDAPLKGRAEMKSDATESPDVLALVDLKMFVIKRGDKYGIRLRDAKSELRRKFTGLHWFPVNRNYRVIARFVSYPKPKPIPIPNILGMIGDSPSPGYATFSLHGRLLRLEPIYETDDAKELFYIFKDATSGEKTYPAGRFLYSDLPKNGTVVLDFNKAYNPPCAFTPFATCPLPPKQNQLPVGIEAGELTYGTH